MEQLGWPFASCDAFKFHSAAHLGRVRSSSFQLHKFRRLINFMILYLPKNI